MPDRRNEYEAPVLALARALDGRFTPPEYIPGCEVKAITDINEYTTDNGWIEAVCGQHNQQRVRYRGFPAGVAVSDFVDVMHFPDRKTFEVQGVGGTVTNGLDTARVSKIYESDLGGTALLSDASGNIGIGTPTPSHDIHIERTGQEAALAISSEVGQSESIYFGYPLATTSFAIYRPASTTHLRLWHSVGGDHVTLTDGGNFGIGTTAPGAVLDIVGGVPPLRVSDVETDATNKIGRFIGRHYTNAEADVSVFLASSTSGATEIALGGGDSPRNSATLISFWTGATNTTAGGSERARITSGGDVGIGTVTVAAKLHIDQSSTTAAIPVLTLDQADLSEEFIDLVTTVGAGNPVDTAAVGTYYGKARVAVNGTFKFIALYDS